MRRFVQLMALVVMVLAGSMPGLHLLGPAHPHSCCASMPQCPCPMPDRSPAPIAPCGLGANAPVVLPANPSEAAWKRQGSTEPVPFPRALQPRAAALLAASSPRIPARPGPSLPPGSGPGRQAALSVFRI